jgi:hypothetical protein
MARRGESYRIAGAVLLNGNPYQFSSYSVDINAYSISSAITARLPLRASDAHGRLGPLTDFAALAQKTIPLPIQVRIGYTASPDPQPPVPTISLEQGYIDGSVTSYDGQDIVFNARGTASIFQDIQIGNPVNRNIRGSDLVKGFFAKSHPGFPKGIPLVAVDSPVFTGKTHDDALYVSTMRNRTMWDEMAAAALDDGFVLNCHNGQGYYGPPSANAPTLPLVWGGSVGNVTTCLVRHAPRRNHTLAVRVYSYLKGAGRSARRITASYGHANASDGATFVFFVSGLTQDQAKQKAQAIFLDISRREFILEAELVPDATFIQTVAKYGANFSVSLQGKNVMPSQKITYAIRQVRFSLMNAQSLTASIVASNINPSQEGAELSAGVPSR